MLGRYNITVREEVLKQLEDGPQAWKALKKRMLQRWGICYCLSSPLTLTLPEPASCSPADPLPAILLLTTCLILCLGFYNS